MRSSNFTDEKKRQILNQRNREGITVREICKKHNISIPTYYAWRRNYFDIESDIPSKDIDVPDKLGNNKKTEEVDTNEENRTLRRLYINLSAHNYELAKFLEK